MAKETAKTGFVERATVDVLYPAAEPLPGGWYWYKGEPVLLYSTADGQVVRGYNFDTKEEWRRTDINLSELRLCE